MVREVWTDVKKNLDWDDFVINEVVCIINYIIINTLLFTKYTKN